MFKAVIDLLERTLLKERAEKRRRLDEQNLRKERRIMYDKIEERQQSTVYLQQVQFTCEHQQKM